MKRKTIDQNSWDAVQMVLRGITLNSFIRKEEGFKSMS